MSITLLSSNTFTSNFFAKMFVCALLYFGITMPAHAKGRWVQIHADITYSRNYSHAGTDPKYPSSTQSSFTLTGALDQMMWRMDPERGQKYPRYINLDEIEPIFKSAGSVSLDANFHSEDRVSKRKDNAKAKLAGVLKSWDDFYIERIEPQTILGIALSAELKLKPSLSGTVTSTLPLMPDTTVEDTVLIWITPIAFDSEVKKFFAEIAVNAHTPFGPRPKEEAVAKMYDLYVASMGLTEMAQVGGAMVAGTNASVAGGTDNWMLTQTISRDVDIGSDRGSYKETLMLTLKPVATTLPVPRSPED